MQHEIGHRSTFQIRRPLDQDLLLFIEPRIETIMLRFWNSSFSGPGNRIAHDGSSTSHCTVYIRTCQKEDGSLGEEAVRRILGVLNLTKKYGVASTDEACAIGLETGANHYHFVRRYLERNPQLPLSLRQVDPLIRQLTLYRDLIESRTQNSKQENPL